ncbi:MAG: S1C family serine protease [Acidimicrobiales bacterium]
MALATAIVVTLFLGFVGAGVAGRGGAAHRSGPAFVPSGDNGTAVAALDLATLVAKVDPSVVDIAATLGYDDGAAEGTGMVLTSDGEVLTNNHVIQGATSLSATVNGRSRTYDVKVLGRDAAADVALLQLVGASGLTPVEVGEASEVSVGDEVVAIGSAQGDGGPTSVAPGFVSALDQSITAGDPATGTAEALTGLIEVDATLNPGDSGGPLVNAGGQVIGVDTAASVVRRFGAPSDVGFAIPIDDALAVVDQIRTGTPSGTTTIGQPAFLGVQAQFIGPAPVATGEPAPAGGGTLITFVVPGSPAEAAGMEVGHAIVSVDGRRVDSPSVVPSVLNGHDPGDTVTVAWLDRSGLRHTADIRLAAGPV